MDHSSDDPSPDTLPSLDEPRAAFRALDREGARARYQAAGVPFGDHVYGLGIWVRFATGATTN
jgi:hypothetical protein